MYIDGIEFLILIDHSMIVVFNDDDSIFLKREGIGKRIQNIAAGRLFCP
jgi:hypothetical protein